MITAEEVRQSMDVNIEEVLNSIELEIRRRANNGFTNLKYVFEENGLMLDAVIFKLIEAGFYCVRTENSGDNPSIYSDWKG